MYYMCSTLLFFFLLSLLPPPTPMLLAKPGIPNPNPFYALGCYLAGSRALPPPPPDPSNSFYSHPTLGHCPPIPSRRGSIRCPPPTVSSPPYCYLLSKAAAIGRVLIPLDWEKTTVELVKQWYLDRRTRQLFNIVLHYNKTPEHPQ